MSVDRSLLRHVNETRDRYVDTDRPPASTFIFVPTLALPEWLIEIEAVLSLPRRQARRSRRLAVRRANIGRPYRCGPDARDRDPGRAGMHRLQYRSRRRGRERVAPFRDMARHDIVAGSLLHAPYGRLPADPRPRARSPHGDRRVRHRAGRIPCRSRTELTAQELSPARVVRPAPAGAFWRGDPEEAAAWAATRACRIPAERGAERSQSRSGAPSGK